MKIGSGDPVFDFYESRRLKLKGGIELKQRTLAALGCLLLASTLSIRLQLRAQDHPLLINTETPEGKALQEIGQTTEETQKLTLMEKFVQEYPASQSLGWVYSAMQPLYVKTQPDKAIDMGNKLIAINAHDAEAALQALKAAEAKNDADLIIKWSAKTGENATFGTQQKRPDEMDDADWQKRLSYFKDVNQYSEYALYAAAGRLPDPKQKAQLAEALLQRDPASQYAPQVSAIEFMAYRQSGQNDKAVALAEKILEKDQSDADMLLVVADSYAAKKTNPDKVVAYSAKIVELMSKPAPEGVNAADWDKRKTLITGIAHQMAGKTYFNQNKMPEADKELRAALDGVSSNAGLKAETTFMLGMANYNMKKSADAGKYFAMCAAIPSPYQAKAQQNLLAMKGKK